MLGQVAEVGASFDWITPLCTIIQDMLYAPAHHFLIPRAAEWSGREVVRLLRNEGIQTWGLMAINDTLFFSLREKQARRAQYILLMAGIPIAKGLLRPNEGAVRSERRGGASGAPGWLERVLGALGL